MILGLGCDVATLKRIEKILQSHGDGFIEKICNPGEKEYIVKGKNVAGQLAKLWAVKEAAVKALGIGFAQGIAFKDVELKHDKNGKPFLSFHGKASEILYGETAKEDINVLLSVSDEGGYAQAVVIIEKCSC